MGKHGQRIAAIDTARSVALLGMAVFHFVFDLQLFGYVERATVAGPFWRSFSIAVAGSFLFLAGLSLWLAHGEGPVRWPAFLRRLSLIVGAAALVSLATWIAFGAVFVRFGILHSIAAASLIGLAFLRLPAALTLLVALGVLVLPMVWRDTFFDAPWLIWVGLGTAVPPMLDYEPVFPWLAPALVGIAVGQLGSRTGLWDRLARATDQPGWHRAGWPGRHSLLIYLIHQPILFGLVWTVTQVIR